MDFETKAVPTFSNKAKEPSISLKRRPKFSDNLIAQNNSMGIRGGIMGGFPIFHGLL